MTRVQVAIFPAILVGIFSLLAVTSLISKPGIVLASTGPSLAQGASELPEVVQWNGQGTSGTGGLDNPAPDYLSAPETAPSAASQNQAAAVSSGEGCSLNKGYSASVRQWCDLIEHYAGENGLEASLIAALITQESGGDPQAYSHSGAVGLMQVMPNDGLAANFMCVAGPCFADRPSSDELRDPEFNISYGTQMLAGLLNKYGNIRDALLYYGPINVGYYYADKVLGIYNNLQ